MGASYVLGKREGRFGGPERPLSTLGRKGYITYWCGEVARYILGCPKQKTVRIKHVSDETWILPEDIVAALKEMDVLEKRKTASGSIVVNKSKIRAWAEKNKVSKKPVVDVEAFVEEEEGDDEEEEEEEDESEDMEE